MFSIIYKHIYMITVHKKQIINNFTVYNINCVRLLLYEPNV